MIELLPYGVRFTQRHTDFEFEQTFPAAYADALSRVAKRRWRTKQYVLDAMTRRLIDEHAHDVRDWGRLAARIRLELAIDRLAVIIRLREERA